MCSQPKKQGREHSSDTKGNEDSRSNTGSNNEGHVPHDKRKYGAPLRAQRHADSEFRLSTCHQIAERTVKSDHRQEQRQTAKESGEQGEKSFLDQRIANLICQVMKYELHFF